jgi:hypothetical protein
VELPDRVRPLRCGRCRPMPLSSVGGEATTHHSTAGFFSVHTHSLIPPGPTYAFCSVLYYFRSTPRYAGQP